MLALLLEDWAAQVEKASARLLVYWTFLGNELGTKKFGRLTQWFLSLLDQSTI
jgi:hypothetical protein